MAEPSDETTSSGGTSRLSLVARDADDPRALVVHQQALGSSSATMLGNQGIDVALAPPEVEIDAQGMEVALQGGAGDAGEMRPEQPVAEAAGLQLGGGPARPVAVGGSAFARAAAAG